MKSLQIQNLKWDSDFFKIPIGKITLDRDTEIEEVIYALQQSNFALVYLFDPFHNDTHIKDLEYHDHKLYDKKVTFVKELSVVKDKPLTCTEVKAINTDLTKLALQSGSYSRFKLDPKLSDFYVQMYTTWISKSVNGELADTVLACKADNNRINGMVTIKVKEESAHIGLIAVDEHIRNKGVGKTLVNCTESWCMKQGVKKIFVATQLENTNACLFYERVGFTEASIENIYHLWKK